MIRADLIRQRRQELKLTRRDLADQTGLSWAAIEDLEERGYQPDLTLTSLARLAAALAVTPVQLLASSEPGDATPDAAQLGALLYRHADGLQTHALQTAMGWSAERLEHATANLEARLADCGLGLARGTQFLRLTSAAVDSTEIERRLAPLDIEHARVLLDVVRKHRRHRTDFDATDQRRLQTLIGQGLIGDYGRLNPTPELRRSLDLH